MCVNLTHEAREQEDGGLLVMCSLPGSPGVKQLMQMVSVVPGLGVRLQSVFSLTGPKQ